MQTKSVNYGMLINYISVSGGGHQNVQVEVMMLGNFSSFPGLEVCSCDQVRNIQLPIKTALEQV